MDESSMARWYKYYKKIGYSHEQLYDMGLAEQAEPSKGGINLKEAMAKIKKQHDIEESLKPKPDAKLVPNMAKVGEGLVGKKPMEKKPR